MIMQKDHRPAHDIMGFTLIEFIVVLALIVILTSLSFPYLFPSRLSNATRFVFYDLHYARMQAPNKAGVNMEVTS